MGNEVMSNKYVPFPSLSFIVKRIPVLSKLFLLSSLMVYMDFNSCFSPNTLCSASNTFRSQSAPGKLTGTIPSVLATPAMLLSWQPLGGRATKCCGKDALKCLPGGRMRAGLQGFLPQCPVAFIL